MALPIIFGAQRFSIQSRLAGYGSMAGNESFEDLMAKLPQGTFEDQHQDGPPPAPRQVSRVRFRLHSPPIALTSGSC